MNEVIIKSCPTPADLKNAVNEAVAELGGWTQFIRPGERVLLKPNVNTADPFPASSDPAFIRAVAESVLAAGAGSVIIGDSSTFYQKTRRNFEKLGLFDLEKIDPRIKVICFDDVRWIKKKIAGTYLKSISVPEVLSQVDKLIFLPCLKTHYITSFTGALKLGVGLMKPRERLLFHASHTAEKTAELNLAFKPDLIIMDGRKCFITKGPSEGEVREPGLILASVSRLAIDQTGIGIIKKFPGNDLEKCAAEELIQIRRAQELGIDS